MKILQPHKISTEILDLIYDAKQYLIIVSPYVNFKYWERIASELVNAKNRGVRIDFFVRNEPENSASWEQVESLGITPRLVNNLHAKFYFNEKNGVISSMNLLSSSNSNSIEIGCKLETNEELEELKRFVKDFITSNEVKERPSDIDLFISKEKFSIVLEEYIYKSIDEKVDVEYRNGIINIYACSNTFILEIDKVKNFAAVSGIISQEEANRFKSQSSKYLKSGYFDYELIKGDKNHYNTIDAQSKTRLSTTYWDSLRVTEKKTLIVEVGEFIKAVRDFKIPTKVFKS
ncbi:phospholipase D-like domain-containing protein [Pontibacter sp. H249]|uniref:phospholipase D-like domain-containing protein n=1 Tax=Pontibacter sp. H249 TaxID=3133420 RepID=UPI0030C16006